MNDTMNSFTFCQEKNKLEAKNNKSALYNNNGYEPIVSFLYVPSSEEIKRCFGPKIGIPIPIKQINEDYHIKRLKELKRKKEKLYPNKNNINFIHEYNLFFGLTEENENNINEKNENIFFNIDKFGQNNIRILPIKEPKENKKDNINNINDLNIKKNKSSKNFLNIKQYKYIIDEKINLDENKTKVNSTDDFEINIKKYVIKLFH